jgi:3-oxo-5-alpha-steroid 4-dehydrogenase 1
MGKTSVVSRLNLPGRIAWFTMEAPGFLTLLYIMNTLPKQMEITDLPWQNKVLAGLFVRTPRSHQHSHTEASLSEVEHAR